MSVNIGLLMLVNGVASAAVAEKVIEEVIVTGSRTPELVSEVPASVAIIGRDELMEQMKNSPELQKMLVLKVPGFGAATGSTSNSSLTLRGRKALVMIDGVPQSTPLRNGSLGVRSVDASALERVEVVKGASSMYGNGAAGGLINYITKLPASDAEFSGDIGVSSRFSTVDTDDSFSKRIDGTITGTVGDFSYVVNAVYDARGQQKDADGDTMGLIYGLSDLTTKNLFTKFGYQIDVDKTLQLTYNLYDSQQSSDLMDLTGNPATGVKTRAVENTTGNANLADPQGPKDNYNVMLKYNDAELLANTELSIDAYKQKIENVFFRSTRLANLSLGYDAGQSLILSKKEGLRLNLKSDFDWDQVSASFVYGIDMLNDVSSQPMTDGRLWVPEMDMDNKAGYLQTKLVIADDWVVKAGVRREEIDISVQDYSTLSLCSTATTCSTSVDVTGGKLSYQSTTYNFGLRYTAEPLFNPFVSYSEGFDISDLGRLLRTAQVTDLALVETEASVVEHIEVGFSSDWENISFEFAAYQSKSALGTGTKLDPASGIFLPVREPQKIKGFELALDYQANERLNIGATYTHFNGENTDTGVPLTGRYISPDKFTAYLDWQPSDNTRLGLSYQRIGDRDKFDRNAKGSYDINKGPVEGYQLVDARGSYQMDNWEFYTAVENLLNEDYYPAGAQSIVLASYYSKGLGRTATVGMSYRF